MEVEQAGPEPQQPQPPASPLQPAPTPAQPEPQPELQPPQQQPEQQQGPQQQGPPQPAPQPSEPRLVSICLTPVYCPKADPTRTWHAGLGDADPLAMLAVAAEQAEAGVVGEGAGGPGGTKRGRGWGDSEASSGEDGAGAASGGRHSARGFGGRFVGSAGRKRGRGEGDAGGGDAGGGLVLNPSAPRAARVAAAEAYLMRLAQEDYEVYTTAVKNVRARKGDAPAGPSTAQPLVRVRAGRAGRATGGVVHAAPWECERHAQCRERSLSWALCLRAA